MQIKTTIRFRSTECFLHINQHREQSICNIDINFNHLLLADFPQKDTRLLLKNNTLVSLVLGY